MWTLSFKKADCRTAAKAAAVLALSMLSMTSMARAAEIDNAFFAATLDNPAGEAVALEAYRGKPAVINFWARSCMPCRDEFPVLNTLQKQHENAGLAVVGIALENKADSLRDFIKAYELTYPVLMLQDKAVEFMRAVGNDKAGIPFTLVIDRNGSISYQKLGRFDPAELEAAVAAVLSTK